MIKQLFSRFRWKRCYAKDLLHDDVHIDEQKVYNWWNQGANLALAGINMVENRVDACVATGTIKYPYASISKGERIHMSISRVLWRGCLMTKLCVFDKWSSCVLLCQPIHPFLPVDTSLTPATSCVVTVFSRL